MKSLFPVLTLCYLSDQFPIFYLPFGLRNENAMRMQVTAVLETREILNPAAVHPSRKNSSTITKVLKFCYYPIHCAVNDTKASST